jgi:hypothetical protein
LVTDSPPAQEHLEIAEHASHAAAEGGLRAAVVPLSIAVMAVIAATFGSLETTNSATAIIARSDAAIRQGEATDLWGYFQADSIKKSMFEIAVRQTQVDIPGLKAKADDYASREADLQTRAKAKEQEVLRQVAISETAMERHHRLAYATNIVHLAIAIASISIVVRRRWLWYGSLACLVIGMVIGFT